MSLYLARLFQLCILSGTTPRRWNTSVIYLLPKDSEPPIDVTKVRPLSIFVMFRRIFEGLLLPVFTDETVSFNRLHPCQAGFLKGYSTLTHALICHHALSTKDVRLAIFLDFKSAYDKTPASRVLESLKRRGMPSLLRRLIQNLMFRDMNFHLVLNGDLSEIAPRNCGLPQGSALSPIIFDIF